MRAMGVPAGRPFQLSGVPAFSFQFGRTSTRPPPHLAHLARCWNQRIVVTEADQVMDAMLVHAAERHRRTGRVLGVHSMTSSARASSIGGTTMPSALAVLRLMANSSLVGNSTRKSADLLL